MATNAAYVLKAHGTIDAEWLQDCLDLFKERNVCIRKLLLLKDCHPDYFSMMELHFNLPQQAVSEVEASHPFLTLLNEQMAQQIEIKQSLSVL